MTLIDTATTRTVSASYVVAAGALFDMDSGSIRVALGRLVRRGELQLMERGVYGLGSRDGAIQQLIRNWEDVETSVKAWDGQWLAVFCSHLGRSNKTQVRGRERALALFGFARTPFNVWVRPDNLTTPHAQLQATLWDLGLDPDAAIGVIATLSPPIDAATLWDVASLEQRYRTHLQALADSTTRLSHMHDQDAAKESLLVGRTVSRDILLDPLLPQQLINVKLRQTLMQNMRTYNRLGRSLWRRFLAQHDASGSDP